MYSEFSWESNKKEKIQGYSWQPQNHPKAAVIIVHGLGEHSNRYKHVIDFFNSNHIAVYSFDIIGHGKSGGKRGHADSYDAIVSDIMRTLSIVKKENAGIPVFVYGHSLGGALALYMALRTKPEVNGYIITSPGLIPADPPVGLRLFLAKSMDKIWPSFTLNNKLYRPGLSRDTSVVDAYNADPLVHPLISTRLGMQFLTKGTWVIAQANELSNPTLLMQGTQDRLVDPAGTKRFSENAPKTLLTYKEWDGYYHELHNEPEKNLVLEAILSWINKNLSERNN